MFIFKYKSHNQLIVNNVVNVNFKIYTIQIRPLFVKNKRVIISNVSTGIPNNILIDILKPDEIDKLPENLEIHYDKSTYWIYFSLQKLSCFLCKEEGHLTKACKNITPT